MNDPIPIRKRGEASNSAEKALATLRAVAQLPAAEGLQERMKAGLMQRMRAGLPPAEEREEFGARSWMQSAAMRGLAAAAIVLIVVAGGWGAARYGRRPASSRPMGIPRMATPGEFTNSGAMRTPQTLTLPKVPKAKCDVRSAKKRTGKARTGQREKPAARAVRNGSALDDGAPEPK
jgi:hypothetical protein